MLAFAKKGAFPAIFFTPCLTTLAVPTEARHLFDCVSFLFPKLPALPATAVDHVLAMQQWPCLSTTVDNRSTVDRAFAPQ